MLLLVGCSDDNELAQLPEKGEHYLSGLPESIYASFADNPVDQSRIFLDGLNIFWNRGDMFSLFARYYHNGCAETWCRDGDAGALFEVIKVNVNENELINYPHAVYPYSENMTSVWDGDSYNVSTSFQTVQTYVPNSFGKGANIMVAAGGDFSDWKPFFRNVGGYLVINLYGNNRYVKSVQLTALDGTKIAGPALIDVKENGEAVVTMSDDATSQVTLDCSQYNDGRGVKLSDFYGEPTAFWFVLPPVTLNGGIEILVTDRDNRKFKMSTDQAVEITRTDVQPMEALEFVHNTGGDNVAFYSVSNGMGPVKMDDVFDVKVTRHEFVKRLGGYVVELSGAPTTIKEKAFYETDLRSITIPNSVTTIGSKAFASSDLAEINIPASVNHIGGSAFDECSSLHTVNIEPGEGTLRIALQGAGVKPACGTFYDSPLKRFSFDRNIEYVDYSGNPVTEVDEDCLGFLAISNNNVSTEVNIGPNVSKLNIRSFLRGARVAQLSVPGTVDEIGDDVFCNANNLKQLTFLPSPTGTPVKLGCQVSGDAAGAFSLLNLEKVSLDREIDYPLKDWELDKAEEGIFYRCGRLTEVVLGSQMKKISNYMFAESALQKLTTAEGLTHIGERAFYETPLTGISIPKTVTWIGPTAFAYCGKLSSVTIEEGYDTPLSICPQYINSAEWGPFYDSPLSYISVKREIKYVDRNGAPFTPDGSGVYYGWEEGVFANKFYDDDFIATVNLGGGLRTISDYMFCGVRASAVWIPREITSIGYRAFYDCRALSGVTLGHIYPPTLGEDAFDSCDVFSYICVPEKALSNFKASSAWNEYREYFATFKTDD